MYGYLLIIHSYLRWIALGFLLFGLIFIIIKKSKKAIYTTKDYQLFKTIKNVFNLQFLVGISLLLQNPMIRIFWSQLSHSLKWREPRFFGLEHPFMMILSVVLLNVFTYKSKAKINTTKGFPYLFTVYLVLFILIFLSVPWAFSPFTARPNFRMF